jgi:hypothetical protein
VALGDIRSESFRCFLAADFSLLLSLIETAAHFAGNWNAYTPKTAHVP